MFHRALGAMLTGLLCAGAPASSGRVVQVAFHSHAIEGNRLGDTAKQSLLIYLPPSYHLDAGRRYPVVFFLHGFGFQSVPGAIAERRKAELDEVMALPGMQEFIVVEPTGGNSLGGSFYVNSPVTGNWETYITRELVAFMDAHYRTVPHRDARGIAGMSMGGYGCLNLAMRHPQTFAATLSVCGGLLKEGALQRGAMPTWNQDFLNAYGAAFAPDLRLPRPHARIPRFDGTPADRRTIRDWEQGFGDFAGKVKAYLARRRKPVAISILAGGQDEFPWIPEGCEAFSKELERAHIPHTFRKFEGGHEIPADFVARDFVPFFSRHLQGHP